MARAWPGTTPLIVTFHGTDVHWRVVGAYPRRLAWRIDLVAGGLAGAVRARGRAARPAARSPAPPSSPAARTSAASSRCPRAEARRELGLDPDGRYLFFPANPARPEKRHDRAAEVAAACGAELLTGGSIEPERMPLWLNAANAVLVTSDYEGFGMAAVEALACDVPVLSTPVGIAPYALRGIDGLPLRPVRDRGLGGDSRASPALGGSPRRGGEARDRALCLADGRARDRGLP